MDRLDLSLTPCRVIVTSEEFGLETFDRISYAEAIETLDSLIVSTYEILVAELIGSMTDEETERIMEDIMGRNDELFKRLAKGVDDD